jgi:hypothetical protein
MVVELGWVEAYSAARFIRADCADLNSVLALTESLRKDRRRATLDADGRYFENFVRDRHQRWDRLEGNSLKRHVEAGNDHSLVHAYEDVHNLDE